MPPRSSEPRRRLAALRERWGIETSGGAEFQSFKNRFLFLSDNNVNWGDLEKDGTEGVFRLLYGHGSDYRNSYSYLQVTRDLSEFMTVLQPLLWALEEAESEALDTLLEVLAEAKRYSPGIDFGIARRGSKVTLYPQGAKELDRALVEEPLEWLAQYPKVAEQFEQALRIVLAKDADNFRSALDNLRWALEQLLRAVLGNRKPLEKQQDVLLPWLRERGVHQQVVNMYLDLLKRFSAYQNDAVKHGDAWQAAELELTIYVTGALMRLVIQEAEATAGEE